MLGLNDLWLARHGPLRSFRPGHSKRAGFAYLSRRRVQLVLAHPWVGPLTEPAEDVAPFPAHRLFGWVGLDPNRIPAGARILEIPIGAGYGVKLLYLTPHPAVDRAIEARELRVWTLNQR